MVWPGGLAWLKVWRPGFEKRWPGQAARLKVRRPGFGGLVEPRDEPSSRRLLLLLLPPHRVRIVHAHAGANRRGLVRHAKSLDDAIDDPPDDALTTPPPSPPASSRAPSPIDEDGAPRNVVGRTARGRGGASCTGHRAGTRVSGRRPSQVRRSLGGAGASRRRGRGRGGGGRPAGPRRRRRRRRRIHSAS